MKFSLREILWTVALLAVVANQVRLELGVRSVVENFFYALNVTAHDNSRLRREMDARLPDAVDKALHEDRMQSHASQIAALQGDVVDLNKRTPPQKYGSEAAR